MATTDPAWPPRPGPGHFTNTHWSLVLAAKDGATDKAAEALAQVCRRYWYPLYAFVRRQGYSAEDAQDLTQGFFLALLKQDLLGRVSPEKGRFRSFLLACLKHYLSNELAKVRAQKRGGQATVLSIDQEDSEARYRLEPIDHGDAEAVYNHGWALTLLEQVNARLREEWVKLGKAEAFQEYQSLLLGEKPGASYAEAAARLGTSEGAVKTNMYRLRRRFQAVLREEIAATVSSPEEIEDELRHLFEVLGGGNRS